MRVLVSCVPAFGHLNPLLPLARALVDAGHEVAITTGAELRPRAQAAGSAMPPALQPDQASAHAEVIHPLRPMAAPPVAGERLPARVTRSRTVPLVYMTLGTWTNADVSMFRSVADGLADAPVDVLLTVGPGNDPAAIGPLPANAQVEQYVPQSLLLPRCAVVICHGGAGTSLGALACGLPLLLLPQGADQYVISERVVSSGAGLRLLPAEVTPTSVRASVLELLHGVEHLAAARRVQREIATMPGPGQTIPLIEDVAAGRTPRTCRLPDLHPGSAPEPGAADRVPRGVPTAPAAVEDRGARRHPRVVA